MIQAWLLQLFNWSQYFSVRVRLINEPAAFNGGARSARIAALAAMPHVTVPNSRFAASAAIPLWHGMPLAFFLDF